MRAPLVYCEGPKNREEVKNREIRYLPDLSIVNLLSVIVLVQIIMNYYPNYLTDRLYFVDIETPYNIAFILYGTIYSINRL